MAIRPPQITGLTDWRPLARGGFAVVWEARQETLDRLVAVKVDQRRLDVETERLRFLREAGAAGRMSAHPGIVTVHDAGILSDDRPYLVMELCPGGSLTKYLAADRRLPVSRVREIGVRIADALAATHAQGVLHRDVKPANILVDAYDQVGLADFGLAVMPGPEMASEETFEALTPAYTAPEILHRQRPTPSGDVYSLAATLYALLSGRPPRWPESGTPTLTEVLELQQQPVAPLPDVDPALMQVLLRALSLQPDERPTAADFRDQLSALDLAPRSDDAGSAGAAGMTSGASAGADRPVRRRGRRGLVAALAVLVLVGALVAAMALFGRDRGSGAVAAPPASSATSSSEPTSPTASPSSASPAPSSAPTPSPTSATVPSGFTDCTQELGQRSYCAVQQECWAGIISVMDSPALGTPRSCYQTHVYQTFAAGELGSDVRRQSQLDRAEKVRRLCSRATLSAMLNDQDRTADWEIVRLPPQEADGSDTFYRCLFGLGDRDTPVLILKPR